MCETSRLPSTDTSWRCQACTYLNSGLLDVCEVCEAPRVSAGFGAELSRRSGSASSRHATVASTVEPNLEFFVVESVEKHEYFKYNEQPDFSSKTVDGIEHKTENAAHAGQVLQGKVVNAQWIQVGEHFLRRQFEGKEVLRRVDASTAQQMDETFKAKWLATLCKRPGFIRFAPKEVRGDRDVIVPFFREMCTRKKAPGDLVMFLKLFTNGLNQDPELLRLAGLLGDPDEDLALDKLRAVLSVKFGLHLAARTQSSMVRALMGEHEFFSAWRIYLPNSFSKRFCGSVQNATRYEGHCFGRCACKCTLGVRCDGNNGTEHRGGRKKCLEFAGRTTNHSCWAFSFREQLDLALQSGGVMIQVEETTDRHGGGQEFKLGDGQVIETQIAEQLRLQVFRVQFAQASGIGTTHHDTHLAHGVVHVLAERVQQWQRSGAHYGPPQVIKLDEVVAAARSFGSVLFALQIFENGRLVQERT